MIHWLYYLICRLIIVVLYAYVIPRVIFSVVYYTGISQSMFWCAS